MHVACSYSHSGKFIGSSGTQHFPIYALQIRYHFNRNIPKIKSKLKLNIEKLAILRSKYCSHSQNCIPCFCLHLGSFCVHIGIFCLAKYSCHLNIYNCAFYKAINYAIDHSFRYIIEHILCEFDVYQYIKCTF